MSYPDRTEGLVKMITNHFIQQNKTGFFLAVAVNTTVWMHHMDANQKIKSYMGTTKEWYEIDWITHGSNTPRNSSYMATYLPSKKNYPNKTGMTSCGTLLWEQGRTHVTFSYGPLHVQCWSTSKNIFTSGSCRHWM